MLALHNDAGTGSAWLLVGCTSYRRFSQAEIWSSRLLSPLADVNDHCDLPQTLLNNQVPVLQFETAGITLKFAFCLATLPIRLFAGYRVWRSLPPLLGMPYDPRKEIR